MPNALEGITHVGQRRHQGRRQSLAEKRRPTNDGADCRHKRFERRVICRLRMVRRNRCTSERFRSQQSNENTADGLTDGLWFPVLWFNRPRNPEDIGIVLTAQEIQIYPDSAEIRINLLPSGLDAILLPA